MFVFSLALFFNHPSSIIIVFTGVFDTAVLDNLQKLR